MIIYLQYILVAIFAGLACLFLLKSVIALIKYSEAWIVTEKGITMASNYLALMFICVMIAVIAYAPEMIGTALFCMISGVIMIFFFYLFQRSMLKLGKRTGADKTVRGLHDYAKGKQPKSRSTDGK